MLINRHWKAEGNWALPLTFLLFSNSSMSFARLATGGYCRGMVHECRRCSFLGDSKMFKRHAISHMAFNDAPFRCNVCHRVFGVGRELRRNCEKDHQHQERLRDTPRTSGRTPPLSESGGRASSAACTSAGVPGTASGTGGLWRWREQLASWPPQPGICRRPERSQTKKKGTAGGHKTPIADIIICLRPPVFAANHQKGTHWALWWSDLGGAAASWRRESASLAERRLTTARA